MARSGYLQFIPEEGEPYDIPWTLPVDLPILNKISTKRSPTPAEEVMALVQEYYKAQGKSVPSADMRACLDMILGEKKEWAEEAARPDVAPKAEFGSPEYWKDYWAKKRAKGWVPKKEQK
jgi:hypothetical protein